MWKKKENEMICFSTKPNEQDYVSIDNLYQASKSHILITVLLRRMPWKCKNKFAFLGNYTLQVYHRLLKML